MPSVLLLTLVSIGRQAALPLQLAPLDEKARQQSAAFVGQNTRANGGVMVQLRLGEQSRRRCRTHRSSDRMRRKPGA